MNCYSCPNDPSLARHDNCVVRFLRSIFDSKNRKLRFTIPLDSKTVTVDVDVYLSHEMKKCPKGKNLWTITLPKSD